MALETPGRGFGLFAKIFTNRDELSFRGIRKSLWAAILVFPVTVIIGDIRYFNLKIEYWGMESFELMLFPLGLGWLIVSSLPKRTAKLNNAKDAG
jgi:hypothetical protein